MKKRSRPSLARPGINPRTLRLLVAAGALGALAVLAGITSSARADTQGPIDFESYALGDINGQQGWSKTGPYDATVADVTAFPAAAGYGFGPQALRMSDSVTSGSFGDQTFAPGLSQPAGESTPQRFFNASFKIGTTVVDVQPGLHMSVSPDNGQGARMSYLRFEDQSDGVHVYFDGVSDAGPAYTEANFSDVDIATLSRTEAHTIDFSIHFIPGPGNDVVKITIDGVLKTTGTTWEDYYRYDNEHQGGIQPPSVSTMLFRESGDAHSDNAGNGFLIDNLSYASSAPVCTTTGFVRDGIDLTAAQIGGTVSGTLDATGCNIGVYYDAAHPGHVASGSDISGANYYGVVDNGATVNVTGSSIHNIGEVPFNGTQHGNAVLYINGAHGTISGNTVTHYQKNGITVSGKNADATGPSLFKTSVSLSDNIVRGEGPISYIGQNGIQISYGASARLIGNDVSRNNYTPTKITACGLLLYKAGGVSGATKSGISYVKADNSFHSNEQNICNFGKGGSFSPSS